MNSKQRAHLRSLANNVEPVITIGKDGLTDTLLKEIDNALYAHELIKINVLETSNKSVKTLLSETANKLNAIEVCCIGRKFVLYKRSNKQGIKHIEF